MMHAPWPPCVREQVGVCGLECGPQLSSNGTYHACASLPPCAGTGAAPCSSPTTGWLVQREGGCAHQRAGDGMG